VQNKFGNNRFIEDFGRNSCMELRPSFCPQTGMLSRTGGGGVTIYLDVLFAVNAVVNILLLHAACLFAGRQLPAWRILLAGTLGGVYAVLAAVVALPWISGWAGKSIGAAAMILTAYGLQRQTLRLAIWFCILCAAFAGVVLMLTGLFGVEVYMVGGTAVYPISVPTLVLTAGISYCVIALMLKRFGWNSAAESLRPITICVAGNKQRFTALVDTGNLLHDPVSGRQVFVLDFRWAEKLVPALQEKALAQPAETFAELAGSVPGLRLVPYRAVGVPSGLLLAVKSDWILLGNKKVPGATVAFSPSPVSDGAYQVIAGGS